MASYMKNKQTGKYDVIGTVDEMQIGPVQVTTKDGKRKTVTLYRLSKPFIGKFGPLEGKQCVIGTVGRSNYSRDSYESSGYCGYPCPVTGRRCCPENGPCHDCM